MYQIPSLLDEQLEAGAVPDPDGWVGEELEDDRRPPRVRRTQTRAPRVVIEQMPPPARFGGYDGAAALRRRIRKDPSLARAAAAWSALAGGAFG